jgi:hypothetical protein
MHTCTDTIEDNSDNEELMQLEMEVNRAQEAFVVVKAGHANHKEKGKACSLKELMYQCVQNLDQRQESQKR